MMPQVKDPVAPESAPIGAQSASAGPRKLTYGERQGIAMGWVVIALGLFLLLGGLALWAASVLSAGFVGWLISMAVIGVVIVMTIVAISYFVIRPGR
jgi:hypothetical protein